jgi:hypothetical protein
MQMPRVRISLRLIMVAIALIVLNLQGAIATWKRHALPGPFLPITFMEHNRYSTQGRDFVESGDWYDGSEHQTHVRYYPPKPTLLDVWSPVILSSALTLFVAAVIFGPRKESERPASWFARVWGMQFTPAVRATRGLALIFGVIGLNIVGAMATLENRPPALGPLTPDPRGGGRFIQYKLNGTVDSVLENFGAPLAAACRDGGWRVQFNFDGTTEYVLKERGTGFRRITETIWRRPPRPGLLQVCSPIIASSAISVASSTPQRPGTGRHMVGEKIMATIRYRLFAPSDRTDAPYSRPRVATMSPSTGERPRQHLGIDFPEGVHFAGLDIMENDLGGAEEVRIDRVEVVVITGEDRRERLAVIARRR